MLVCGLIWKQYVMSSLMFSNYGDAVNDMHARSCSKLWYWNIKQRMCYITLNNNFSVKWPPAILMIWLVAWVPIENVTVPKRAFSSRKVAFVIIWNSKAWGKMVNTEFNADHNFSYTIFFISTYIFVKFMILFTKQSTHIFPMGLVFRYNIVLTNAWWFIALAFKLILHDFDQRILHTL